jgi:hypothetical protein
MFGRGVIVVDLNCDVSFRKIFFFLHVVRRFHCCNSGAVTYGIMLSVYRSYG